MKDLFIESLNADTGTVDLFAQVTQADRKETKGGKPYLTLKVRDRTGEVDAKLWDIPEGFVTTPGDFLKVRAQCGTYKDALQLKVLLARVLDRSEIDIADYIPASKRCRTEMYTELMGYILDCMSDKSLSSAVHTLIVDHYKRVMDAPAARKMHQAYLGGLLEHILNLCALVDAVCKVYPDLNRDVLLAGAIVHDIGKLFELTYQDSIGASREGQLLGHIIQGSVLWQKYGADLDPGTRDHVAHIIASHHGCKEWGSPVLPATREAYVFHCLDLMDARMCIMTDAVEQQPLDANGFTSYVPAIGTAVWNGK